MDNRSVLCYGDNLRRNRPRSAPFRANSSPVFVPFAILAETFPRPIRVNGPEFAVKYQQFVLCFLAFFCAFLRLSPPQFATGPQPECPRPLPSKRLG
jgi:hypothetical protein